LRGRVQVADPAAQVCERKTTHRKWRADGAKNPLWSDRAVSGRRVSSLCSGRGQRIAARLRRSARCCPSRRESSARAARVGTRRRIDGRRDSLRVCIDQGTSWCLFGRIREAVGTQLGVRLEQIQGDSGQASQATRARKRQARGRPSRTPCHRRGGVVINCSCLNGDTTHAGFRQGSFRPVVRSRANVVY